MATIEKMKHIIFCFLSISIFSCSFKNDVSNETKFEMYNKAINHHSTAPYYVVINVKNLQNGELKEICTEANYVRGALNEESCNDTPLKSNNLVNKDRYFEFECENSLSNIEFDMYSKDELLNYKSTMNLDSLLKSIKNEGLKEIIISNSRKEQRMYAHIMFNNGIMMTRGSVIGNLCTLESFDGN